MDIEWQTLIDSQPVLAQLPARLRVLAGSLNLAVGETLFRIGDPVRDLFLVARGQLRLIRRDRNGTEIVLQRSCGGFFPRQASTAKPTTATR